MSSIESLILGKPRSEPIQNDGTWEAWLERHLPGREIRWRFARRFVLPEEAP
jgi:hypothetical protein